MSSLGRKTAWNDDDDEEEEEGEEEESNNLSSSSGPVSPPRITGVVIRSRSSSTAGAGQAMRSTRICSILELPFEMLQDPLSFLDIPSLEKVSTVCTAFYSASRQSSVWMRYSKTEDPIEGRQLCMYRSGVRFDGIYISKCQYTRRIQEGASLTDNRRRLVVTYYRLLRFLPSGKLLMLRCEPDQIPTLSQLQSKHSNSGLPDAVVRNLEIARAANKPVKAAIDLLRDYDPDRGFIGVTSSKQQKIIESVAECKWNYPDGDKVSCGRPLRCPCSAWFDRTSAIRRKIAGSRTLCDRPGKKIVVEFSFTDGDERWAGALGVESAKTRPGYRLKWQSYRYWSRRALAERLADERTVRRELLLAQLRRVNARSDGNIVLADVLRDLEQMDDLPEEDNSVLDDLSPPPDLVEEMKLPNREHFPPFRFKMFKQLSHLF
ncbi:F-box only protein 9, variant 2 [Perkinsus olseni]|uniref:F-box only protein 9, variant 2 n=1 Tax=Perkinsus olseni TaxID=32597 RepID=A0A7J6NAP0_PEROL|nr:F-box only protein 9, variant 2 [Perkinsus olseni]